MKKSILFSMMAAALLASCSNEEATQVAEGDLVPIRLSMTNADISVSPSTRGTGSIDAWNGAECIYVSAYSSTNPDFTVPMMATVGGDDPDELWDLGARVNGTAVEWLDGLDRFYPMTGSYDFYACHLGLPQEEGDGIVLSRDDPNAAYYALTIDGNQDLMAAKSDNPGSARAARKGNNPELEFKHLLTQLKFQLTDGNLNGNPDGNSEGNDTELTVKGIVVHSKAQGRLILATAEGDEPAFVLDEEAAVMNLPLQGIPAEGEPLKGANKKGIGGSLMVPAAAEYEVELAIEENLNGRVTEYVFNDLPPIELPADPQDGTYVGKSYMVNITLYGSQEVKLTATLQDWEEGGEIEYDPEADI